MAYTWRPPSVDELTSSDYAASPLDRVVDPLAEEAIQP
jgi:hypothetical protein